MLKQKEAVRQTCFVVLSHLQVPNGADSGDPADPPAHIHSTVTHQYIWSSHAALVAVSCMLARWVLLKTRIYTSVRPILQLQWSHQGVVGP